MATSGPGAVHLLNGLYDAKLDHQPVAVFEDELRKMPPLSRRVARIALAVAPAVAAGSAITAAAVSSARRR